MRKTPFLLALGLAYVWTSPAAAQDYQREPIFGPFRLRGGFTPDPNVMRVQAGGPIDAAREIRSDCRGWITRRPTLQMHWEPGVLPLTFQARSTADTTLVVLAPDGRWYCNDDTDGLNPAITFQQSGAGRYDIWVGTYASGPTQAAELLITELADQGGDAPPPPDAPEAGDPPGRRGRDWNRADFVVGRSGPVRVSATATTINANPGNTVTVRILLNGRILAERTNRSTAVSTSTIVGTPGVHTAYVICSNQRSDAANCLIDAR